MSGSRVEVLVVAYRADNYAYVVHGADSTAAIVIDAGEAGPVVAAVRDHGLTLEAVLSTHHHADHVGGNVALGRAFPALRVFGAAVAAASIPALTDPITPPAVLSIAGLTLRVLATPGHTHGGLAFAGHGWVFTGDTLFGAGCGRLFEGTAAELYGSLRRLADDLPATTRVGFGHEYTAANLRFAARVEPNCAAIAERAARVAKRRAEGLPSAPSTLGEELATNPFLRTGSPALRATLGVAADVTDEAVFALLRALKDRS